MKKILSVVIAISMLLGMMIPVGITASAAEATECATWAEVVAAVEADATASIKLTDHVTANSTIASFAGTFDGNGYTVTVETTMFAEVTGTATLKNFQTAAAAAITVAPIVNLLKGTATVVIENVVNNVDVAESTEQMGGIIAKTSGTVSLTMTSCVNNGDLQTVNQASGIVGNADGTLTVNFTDVVNNGNITGNQNYAAGILCTNGGVEGTMTRVVNNGNIVIESKKANNKGSNGAGIIGTAKGKTIVTLTECVNTGDVTLITTNTSAHYGVSAFATRTDNESSVFTLSGCVSTGVMTSASEGTVADAIALPAKKGAATATNTSYVNGTTTVAGATKVEADAAAASIAAIEAKMTLPTFDDNKAPETDAPEGGDTPDLSERYELVLETELGTITVEGPKTMIAGTDDVITVTFDAVPPGTINFGVGFTSGNTAVVDFKGTATMTNDLDYDFEACFPDEYLRFAFVGSSKSAEPVNFVTVTIPVSALAAGTSDITLFDEDMQYQLLLTDEIAEDYYYHEDCNIGYTITVVDENADEPTEPTVVDTVNVNGYVAPTVGADIAANLAALTVLDGAGYTITDAYWSDGSSIIYNGTFEAGETYILAVEFALADGYALADSVSFTINGSADLVDTTYSFANDGGIHLESVSTTLNATGSDEPTVIDTIGINGFVKPTEGASVAENIAALQAAGEGYTISAVWYTFGDELAGDTFGASSHFLRVAITANEGYIIADNATFTINGGANDDIIDASNSTVYEGGASALLDTVYITVEGEGGEGGDEPTEPIVVDTVNVNGYVAPTVGASLADALANLSVPADAPYSIIDAYWYNDTVNDYVVEETFLAGNSYSLGVEIKLADGYVLADEYTIQFNGDASLCDPLYILEGNENTDYDLRFFSVSTTLPAEGGDTPTESIPVDLINVNGYVAPTVGASIADSLAGLSVPADAPYSIAELHWLDETTAEMLTEGTFLAGHIYSLGVAFNLADGYALAEDPTFQLNGDATLVNPLASGTGDEFGFDFFYYSVSTTLPGEGSDTPIEPTEKIEIDSVDVSGITAPTHGQTVGDYKASLTLVLPEGANYSVRSITITEINPETLEVIDMLADGDVFDSSKTYSVGILVEADDGYVFATDAVITANGGEYEPINTLIDGDKAGVAVAFTPDEGGDEPTEPIVIDTINVNGYVAPTAGANIADNLAGLSVPADAPYSIVNAHWYNDTLDDIAYEETFVAGYSYSLCVEIKLADGYVLAAEWTEQLNGNAALVDSQYSGSGNEETDYDLYYYSLITDLEGELSEIDTINVNGYVAPTVGADIAASLAGLSVPEGVNYSITNAYWYNVTIDDYLTEGTFEAGNSYRLNVEITSPLGYVFATDLNAQFNGNAALVDTDMIYTYRQGVDYYSVATTLSAEGGDEPTEDIEIDKIDVSGITAPEYGKTVADYKASFAPVLPEGANYSVVMILWFELDPETMEGNGVLADDYVFDSSKTYGFGLGIVANDGYTFADGAVITANGGATEVYASMAEGSEAALALVFNPAPATGDSSTIAVFAIAAVATIGCVAFALRKKKED